MKLGSLIDKDYILVGDDFGSVEEAIDKLLELFSRKKRFPISIEAARKIVLEREKLGGTVLPTGVAIPHGRIDGFNDLLLGLWVPPAPLKNGDTPIQALFFALTSKSGTALYLPVLAALAKMSSNKEFFARFTSAESRAEVQELLDEVTLKKEVSVEDIMLTTPITCRKDNTLAELADLFYEKNVSYIPVVDQSGRQIGEVTVKDLLSRGVPDYVRRLGNVRFLKTLEPFEALLREEDSIHVSEIMRKPSRRISPDASIIEAVAMITSKGVRHLPVMDGDKLLGVISETDILNKVLRG